MLAVGCSGELDDLLERIATTIGLEGSEEDPTHRSGDERSDDPQGPTGLACEREGYPCTWDAVADEQVRASFEVADQLDELAADGWDPDALAAMLDEVDGLADAVIGVDALFFRLDGARPVWILADAARVRDAQDDTRASAPSTLPGAIRTPDVSHEASVIHAGIVGRPPGPAIDDGGGGPSTEPIAVVGDDPRRKSALVLSIYEHEGLFWAAREVADLLEETPGYEDGVDYLANLEPPSERSDLQVGPEHFTGWQAYDVVYVATHGAQICEEEHCWTALSLGLPIEEVPETRATDDLLTAFGFADTPGVTIARQGRRVLPVIEGDWLANQYGGGLQDTLVYVQACASARAGDLAGGLSGPNSVFLGWSATAFAGDAGPAAIRFFEEAAERGVTSTTAFEEVVAADLHRSQGTHASAGQYGPGDTIYRVDEQGKVERVEPPRRQRVIDAELLHHAPGTDLRIREVVELQHPATRARLVGGEVVPLGDDDGVPTLPVRLQVDGVLAGQEADFEVSLAVNGVRVDDRWRLDIDAAPAGDEVWIIEDEVRLPPGFADAEELELDARVSLPEGGRSQHIATIEPAAYELRFEAETISTLGGIDQARRLAGTVTLEPAAEARVWSASPGADWLTHTMEVSHCPESPYMIATTSDVVIPRVLIDVATETVELDLRWAEATGGPPITCQGMTGLVPTMSEHDLAISSYIIAVGAIPDDPAAPTELPAEDVFDFVDPDTFRLSDWSPGSEPGSFVYEVTDTAPGSGGQLTARWRLELVPAAPGP